SLIILSPLLILGVDWPLVINTSPPNGRGGDSPFQGWTKANLNFEELFKRFGHISSTNQLLYWNGTNLIGGPALVLTNGTNFTIISRLRTPDEAGGGLAFWDSEGNLTN